MSVTKGKPLLPKMVKMAAEEMMLQRMRLKTMIKETGEEGTN